MSFAVRTHFAWHLRSRTLELGSRTLLMGILNVTPDSFSDGGECLAEDAAVRHALAMLDEGADLVDIGGESTRPNAVALSPAEEQARAMPVLRAILRARPEAIVSIDTYHAETARMAVEAGAEIVNDVSGFLWDAGMAAACAELKCGVVLMHTRGRSQEWRGLPPLARDEVMPMVMRDLQARSHAAMEAGVAREVMVLDPGFGFGKRLEENLPLLGDFERLQGLGFPLMAGVSRKSFLRRAVAEASGRDDAQALLEASTAANTAAVLAGAHILRVHEVGAARSAAAVADRVLGIAR